MKSRSRVDMTGVLLALIAVLCWCTVPLFIKYFTQFFDKHTQNGLRYSVAAVLWLPALVVMLRSGRIDRRIWIAAIFPAAVNTIAQVSWTWSLYFLDPAIVAFSTQINAIWANVLAMCFFRDERSLLRQPLFWLGTLASSAGFALMMGGHPNLWSHDTLAGLAILVAGSIPWGLYPVSVRRNMSTYPPIAAFSVIALYTAIACDVLMLGWGEPGAVFTVSWQVLGWVALSAILGIGLAHVLYYAALNRLGVAVTAGILLLTPFLTAIMSAAFWDEHLRLVQWLGGAGLVAGTAFLVRAKYRLGRSPQAQEATPAFPARSEDPHHDGCTGSREV
jgi:O-acetylserine/cysteine efflux transporter